ncbi:MAG: hypothetical protein AB1566_08520 [Chloroflexota bacterium]
MNPLLIEVLGGSFLVILGLLGLWKPSLVWGLDLSQIKDQRSRERILRRWRLGSVGFVAAGLGFLSVALYQTL